MIELGYLDKITIRTTFRIHQEANQDKRPSEVAQEISEWWNESHEQTQTTTNQVLRLISGSDN